jgi:hypothetical protein
MLHVRMLLGPKTFQQMSLPGPVFLQTIQFEWVIFLWKRMADLGHSSGFKLLQTIKFHHQIDDILVSSVLMLATDGANQPAIPSLMYLSIKAALAKPITECRIWVCECHQPCKGL